MNEWILCHICVHIQAKLGHENLPSPEDGEMNEMTMRSGQRIQN